ncbi:MAG TPA: sulfotransferase [Parafilimonas sp.]|nr:sulfotransferase [Parafilimonas sp.]
MPDFIFIGSFKCASSSVHFYLGQHPQIFASTKKETGFFSLHYSKGMDFYAQFFEGAQKDQVLGETTPTYCFLPYVAERIHKHYPNAKLLLCLRNPVERAFSSWLMATGLGRERLPFDAVMEKSKRMYNQMKETLAGPGAEEFWIENNPNAKFAPLEITSIIAGEYAQMLKLYYRYFKPGQIKIIRFEDIYKNLDPTLSDIFSFLGVDPNFVVPNKESVNFYFDRSINEVFYKVFGLKTGRAIIDAVPKSVKNKLKHSLKKPPPKLTMEQRVRYWEFFKDDVAELESMLDADFSYWNPEAKKVAV